MHRIKASLFYIPLITGAIWLACDIRGLYSAPFMTFSTNTLQGRFLFGSYYYPMPVFLPELKKILFSFLLSYIIPALLIWLASYLLYRWILDMDLQKASDFLPDSNLDSRGERIIMASLFIAGFALSAFFSSYLFLNSPSNSDEFSYLFQAKIMEKGKLYEISPPLTNPFQAVHLINDGHWFSKYPIGWPAFMAAGGLLGNYHLFADLSLGLFLVIFYLTARELYGRSSCRTGLLFLICSPYLFFNAASFQPHMADLCLLSVSFLMLVHFLKSGRPLYSFLLSLSIGLSIFVRPVDTALIFPVYLFLLLRNPFREPHRAPVLKTFILSGVPVLIAFSVAWLIANHQMTGGFFKTGYSITDRSTMELKSFIPMLWDLAYPLMRLFIWLPYPVFELFIAALFAPARHKTLLLAMILPTLVFYMAWGQGGIEAGPRYYFPILGFVILLAVSGLSWLGERLRGRGLKKPALFIQCLLCCSIVVSAVALFPGLPDRLRQQSLAFASFQQNVEANVTRDGKDAIVFVRNLPGDTPSLVALRNFAPLRQKVIYANFLEPSENKAVISMFPGRTPYLLRFEPSSNEMLTEPYTEERQNSRELLTGDIYCAAFNYQGICINGMARKLYREVISLDSRNVDAYMKLAKLQEEDRDYSGAIATLQELSTATGTDYSETHYYSARIYAKEGNYLMASKEMDKTDIGRLMPSERPRAEDFKRYIDRNLPKH